MPGSLLSHPGSGGSSPSHCSDLAALLLLDACSQSRQTMNLEHGRVYHPQPSKYALQVNSLRELVEDWYFEEGPFMEFAAPALHLLAGLLNNSTELETQLQVCRPHFSDTVLWLGRHDGHALALPHAQGCP